MLLVGNLGLLVAGFAARGRIRAWTLAAATVAIGAALLFFDGQAMGVGVGTMERLAVLPLPLWACCVATGLLAAHLNALGDDLSAGDVGQPYRRVGEPPGVDRVAGKSRGDEVPYRFGNVPDIDVHAGRHPPADRPERDELPLDA